MIDHWSDPEPPRLLMCHICEDRFEPLGGETTCPDCVRLRCAWCDTARRQFDDELCAECRKRERAEVTA